MSNGNFDMVSEAVAEKMNILPRTVKYNQLRLGDKVQVLLPNHPYGTATVIKVVEATDEDPYGKVVFFRPYVITSKFSTTAGVIPYVGTEEFNVCREKSTGTVTLLERDNDIR